MRPLPWSPWCEGRVELSALKGRTYVISDRRGTLSACVQSMRAVGQAALDRRPEPRAMIHVCEIERACQFDGDAPDAVPIKVDREHQSDQPCLRRDPRAVSDAESVSFKHSAKVGLLDEGAHVTPNDSWRRSEQQSYCGVFQPPTSATRASASAGPHDPGA